MLYVGMDFGTFKTAASASNGRRCSLETAIGRPKDHVSRAMLGQDIVFGKEIHQVRTALDIVRPFAKGALKYLSLDEAGVTASELERRKEAARLILEKAVSDVRDRNDGPLYAAIGAPSRASTVCKQLITEAAEQVFDAVLIVAEPFAVAYGMGRLSGALIVDVGAGTTDICPMLGRYPSEDEQITIPLGGDWIDEELCKLVAESHPEAQFSPRQARNLKEKFGFVHEEPASTSIPVNGQPVEYDLTQALLKACDGVVQPIVEGIRQVIANVDPDFQRQLLDNIILAGGGSQLKRFDRLLEDGLKLLGGAKVSTVPDCEFAGSAGALKLAMSMPSEEWGRLNTEHVSRDAA